MQSQSDFLDILWGVKDIAAFIGRPERATYHLLSERRLPAKLVGGRWCASRAALRDFFAE